MPDSEEMPWTKYLAREHEEKTFIAHGREFVVTTDAEKAQGPTDGRAVFSTGEIARLKKAAGSGKIPKALSLALHDVKSILGGGVSDIVIDPDC